MKQKIKPSAAETAILTVLWEHEPCSVKDIHERLRSKKDVGYTTTLKQIQRMFDKGLVTRERGEGKSYNYKAIVSEDETKSHLFNRFVETTFSNSVSDLVMHALGKPETSEDEIEKIKQFLRDMEQNT
ncbi:BlaI/MecI/CopY family transcriptional regulator [Hellea balneolensis]|uniref:BlaI/MecI/CopY family transcriptional regulator n=1 Tax=Hellea balneolensis TaxID=287478 RepID=UPI000408CE76|nr:BlaI/MecI/CopY family transcriptional regulator [Hellea balneolensis]